MAYITLETADRLFLVTPRDTKKYRGEQTRNNTQALTLTGTCYVLEHDDEISKVKAVFNRHHPHLQNFIRNRDVAFLCVEFDSFLFLDGPERAHHEILREKRSE